MFGVIVCSRCTLVQGADLEMARVTCPRCGHKIVVRKAKVYFSTDSTKELAEAVRQVGERLVYDVETFSPPRRQDPPTAGPIHSEGPSLRPTLERWLEEGREFSRDELLKASPGSEEEEVDRVLDRLLSEGIIYEASFGRYRPS